jgi:hypothetical protein
MLAVGLIGLFGLAGCAAAPLGAPGVATTGMPNIQTALNRAITRTDDAVDQLNGTPVLRLASAPLPTVVPAELQQPIGWQYRGHLVHAVRALAKIVGWQVVVDRSKPHRPIPVSVTVSHVPVMTVIRELGIQAGNRADVTVNDRTHTIMVIETDATQSSSAPQAIASPGVNSASIPVASRLPADIQPGGPMIPASGATAPHPLTLN